MRRSTTVLCLALIVATAVLAGCGSSTSGKVDETNSNAHTWAVAMCRAFGTWKTDVQTATTDLKQNPTQKGLHNAWFALSEASGELKSTFQNVGLPETTASSQARAAVDQLRGTLQTESDKMKSAVDNGTTLEAITTITTSLTTVRGALTTAGSQLRSLPGGDLKQAIETTPECQALKTSF